MAQAENAYSGSRYSRSYGFRLHGHDYAYTV